VPVIAPRRELFRLGDCTTLQNSGYTHRRPHDDLHAYFVGVVVGRAAGFPEGTGTLLWTVAVSIPMPWFWSVHRAGGHRRLLRRKKAFSARPTIGLYPGTALLALTGRGMLGGHDPGSALEFHLCPGRTDRCLPSEISKQGSMGRVSAYGWAVGLSRGLTVLGVCLAYVSWAAAERFDAAQYCPCDHADCRWHVALAATPTFLWLKERPFPCHGVWANIPSHRFHAPSHPGRQRAISRPVFRFLMPSRLLYVASTPWSCCRRLCSGSHGFSYHDTIVLVIGVNVTAALGAFLFGQVQDRLGSLPSWRSHY